MGEKPIPEIEAKGLKAYEQARAFERMRTWRLPLVYAASCLVTAALTALFWRAGNASLAAMGAGFTVFIVFMVCMQWKRLVKQHEENLVLLAKLEAKYGDALPWVQVEKHFAALEELKREIAEGKAKD